MTTKRLWLSVAISAAVLAIVACAAPLIGSTGIRYGRALAGVSPDYEILFYARLPRVALSLIAGGTLAVTGLLFQALLRDALADPYTLGISSGAAFGAVLAICFGWRTTGTFPAVWLAAFTGAGVALLLVLAIAFEGRRLSSFTLLLAGVTINSICVALILFLHNLATVGQSFAIERWLMGGIEEVDYSVIGWLALAVVPVCI
ncbi:MAG: FecCD family ABC transporter permease, partial [Bryobacteraceae bacterium]